MDPGKGDAEKSPESPQKDSSKSAQGSALQAWLPLLGAIVLLPVVAYGITTFILLPKLQKGLGITVPASPAHAPAAAASGHGAPPADAKKPGAGAKDQMLLNKMIVNVAGTMGSRFLMTSLTMVSDNENFHTEVTKNEAQLRDTACGILSTKTIPDLEKPGARNLIRSELITAFNNILGASMVREIYFTDFAIQ
jgi:flagellar FliL protein